MGPAKPEPLEKKKKPPSAPVQAATAAPAEEEEEDEAAAALIPLPARPLVAALPPGATRTQAAPAAFTAGAQPWRGRKSRRRHPGGCSSTQAGAGDAGTPLSSPQAAAGGPWLPARPPPRGAAPADRRSLPPAGAPSSGQDRIASGRGGGVVEGRLFVPLFPLRGRRPAAAASPPEFLLSGGGATALSPHSRPGPASLPPPSPAGGRMRSPAPPHHHHQLPPFPGNPGPSGRSAPAVRGCWGLPGSAGTRGEPRSHSRLRSGLAGPVSPGLYSAEGVRLSYFT